MRSVSLEAGARVFSTDDPSDEIYFVRRGRVDILLPLGGGKRHHVTTLCRGEFFGEMAFIDQGRRSADAEAPTATELFVLSRKVFDTLAAGNRELAAKVFEELALAIGQRLRATDAEVRALEER